MLELAWDGEWYRRGYFDDGTPLGSAQNDECRIDSIAQSWAVLSGAAPARCAERAMDAVRAHLVRRGARADPAARRRPSTRSPQDPGYISGLPARACARTAASTRTPRSGWSWRVARLGSGDEAVELFHMLNPVNHTRTPADVERYKRRALRGRGRRLRPSRRTPGRGGWTWYTGSAGWMYRAGLESILGLRRRGDVFAIGSLHPVVVAGLRDPLALRQHALRDHGREPGPPLPRCRRPPTLDGRAVDPARDPARGRRRSSTRCGSSWDARGTHVPRRWACRRRRAEGS